jgi:hypothetical protein
VTGTQELLRSLNLVNTHIYHIKYTYFLEILFYVGSLMLNKCNHSGLHILPPSLQVWEFFWTYL